MPPIVPRVSVALLALAAAACTVRAGDFLSECKASREPEPKITMCTHAIEKPGVSARDVGWAYFHRALAHNALGRADDALRDADAAVSRNPREPDILAGRAGLLVQAGRLDEGQRDIAAALAIAPDNVMAIGNRGLLLAKRRDYSGARADMARLMTLDPTNYQPHTELCWIGAILMDQLDATEAACAKALAMEPKDANNHNNLGFLRFRQGRFEESIAAYTNSISGNPDVASSFLVRGLAKRALGQPGAEEDVSKGLELDPGVAARYASYGVVTEVPAAAD